MFTSNNIRPTNAQDLTKLSRVVLETELFPPEMLDQMIAPFLNDALCRDIWITYQHNEELIGFAYCEPERMTASTWNVLAIAVLPARQGQGIGQQLMSFIEQQLQQQGPTTLIVETSGLPAFEGTRAFYDKIGYAREARIRDFYDRGDDKIIFWKSLG